MREGLIPFKLSRKTESYVLSKRYQPRRSITNIELIGIKETQCIKVDAEDSLYLTDDFIITHNTDDPRKDEDWYTKKCNEIDDPVIIAQELDLNYAASMEGILIPATWVQASIDAHIKLALNPTGLRKSGLDIADEGQDKNALCIRYGILFEHIEVGQGKERIYMKPLKMLLIFVIVMISISWIMMQMAWGWCAWRCSYY